MLAGVIVMAALAVHAVRPVGGHTGLAAATEHLRRLTPPDGRPGDLVYGPGPRGFLPLGLAFSFFLMWSLMGAGQPSGMVRLMSFKDSASLRRALLLIAGYYVLIYVSLLIIFVCARAIFPTEYLREVGSEGEPDSIMPVMARHLAHPLVAGLLLAAPYAAIMSTVAAFLLMISSSLVRDLYQRVLNPKASQTTLRRASYAVTAVAGLVVMLGAVNPPAFLQYIIVFTASGQGCAFLAPMGLALYWRRATRQGTLAGMLGGFLVVFGLYALGWVDNHCQALVRERQLVSARAPGTGPPVTAPGAWGWLDGHVKWVPDWGRRRETSFEPLSAGGLDPLVWGLAVSLLLTVGVSLATRPDPELVKKYFPGGAA
jgi:SSS family solute:Na+ symporter/sodium/pantothenate symporter